MGQQHPVLVLYKHLPMEKMVDGEDSEGKKFDGKLSLRVYQGEPDGSGHGKVSRRIKPGVWVLEKKSEK